MSPTLIGSTGAGEGAGTGEGAAVGLGTDADAAANSAGRDCGAARFAAPLNQSIPPIASNRTTTTTATAILTCLDMITPFAFGTRTKVVDRVSGDAKAQMAIRWDSPSKTFHMHNASTKRPRTSKSGIRGMEPGRANKAHGAAVRLAALSQETSILPALDPKRGIFSLNRNQIVACHKKWSKTLPIRALNNMGTRFFYRRTCRQSDADVLADLRRVAAALAPKGACLSYRLYRRRGGRFSATLFIHRFGSWNQALRRAGLRVGRRYRIPDEALFAQIERCWTALARPPTRADMNRLPGRQRIPWYTYARRFGTWGAALRAFVAWRRQYDRASLPAPHPRARPLKRRNTPRTPSIGLRYRILKRDNFKCIQCGRSPALDAGVVLHIDHITPWSDGGQTVMENLQMLCERCNRGKSNQPP